MVLVCGPDVKETVRKLGDARLCSHVLVIKMIFCDDNFDELNRFTEVHVH
jgi:hypothetical protein